MRLTWKDFAATVLVAASTVATVAVIQAWGWPLLGSVRAGTAVVFLIGMAGCMLSGAGDAIAQKKGGAGVAVASVLGIAALVFAAIGLIAGSEWALIALAITNGALWLETTARHLIVGQPMPAAHHPTPA
jgi:hypothetical protein